MDKLVFVLPRKFEIKILCQVKREIMSVTLVHHFHSEVSTVEDVSPSVKNSTLSIKDGLVEVETIQVECHRAHAKGGEPDANHRPCGQEKVK